MSRISQLQAPILAGVVREYSQAAAVAEIKNCMYSGATMIDLHMSCLEKSDTDSLRKIISSTKLPILALNYNQQCDWENAGLTEEERIASLIRAVDAGASAVDMQGYSFHEPSKHNFCGEDVYSFTKNNPKEIVTDESIISKQCEFIEMIHSKGAEVLLSCHPGVVMDCEQVVDLALFLEKRNPDVIKIVTAAYDDEQLLESFKTMLQLKKEVKTPVSYHTFGKAGMLSRVINPVLGGHIAFCVESFNESSTMEQLDLRCAKAVIDNIERII